MGKLLMLKSQLRLSATALDGVSQTETVSSFQTTCNGFRFPFTQEKIVRAFSLDTSQTTWFVLEVLVQLLAMVILVAPLSALVPGTTGLVPGSAAEAQWYQQQLAQIALIAGRKKRSLPVPGTTGLVPGSAAEAQWYQQQLAQIAVLAGRKKRSLAVPGTIPGLVPGSVGEAQWYQAQLEHIALNGKK